MEIIDNDISSFTWVVTQALRGEILGVNRQIAGHSVHIQVIFGFPLVAIRPK